MTTILPKSVMSIVHDYLCDVEREKNKWNIVMSSIQIYGIVHVPNGIYHIRDVCDFIDVYRLNIDIMNGMLD